MMERKSLVRHEKRIFREYFPSCDGKEFNCKIADSRSLIIAVKASRTHFSTLVCPSSDSMPKEFLLPCSNTQGPHGGNRRVVMSVCNRNHVRCIILQRCGRGGETDQQTPASLNQAKHIPKEQD